MPLKNYLKNIAAIFYPDTCITCGRNLVDHEDILCTFCLADLPNTDFCETPLNSFEKKLAGRVPLQAATSLLYFRKKGKVQQLIHALKYQNRQDVGSFFGKIMGENMKDSKRFQNLEAIVMVPLHPKKQRKRGYNQLSFYAKELSKKLNIPVYDDVLIKVAGSTSQTTKDRFRRFEKMNERFHLENVNTLRGKHVLLIDDVFTTGATIEACSNELLKTPGIKLSIATMVYTEDT